MPRSLTTRVSTFFLAVLGCVLVGFAATFYFLSRTYLYGQVDDRLDAAVNTLVAAAEVTEAGVEWEPTDHSISMGNHTGNNRVIWLVRDEKGRILEQSTSLSPDQQAIAFPLLTSGLHGERMVDQNGEPWRICLRRLSWTNSSPNPNPSTAANVPAGENNNRHASIDLSVGASLAAVEQTLERLALILVGLSIGLWIVAAVVGRWLCRDALVPVTRLATIARGLQPDALDQQLPSPQTRDELEDLSHAFNELLARLHESFERQARFTGDASHQLRSPLTAMLGQIDVALLRERSPDEYRQSLSLVREQAGRLSEIVETLLFLSRADREAQLPNLEPLEISVWLSRHLQNWCDHTRAGDIRRDFAAGESIWNRAQSSLLAQLLDNLLDNAAKYSPPVTPITVRLTSDHEFATVTVEDVGYGIAAEDLPHIFEPFFRSAGARQMGKTGIGLGLAVAQRIARAFGGEIVAECSAGQSGSHFSLRLPRRPEPAGL